MRTWETLRIFANYDVGPIVTRKIGVGHPEPVLRGATFAKSILSIAD